MLEENRLATPSPNISKSPVSYSVLMVEIFFLTL